VADELVMVLSDMALVDGQLESPDSGGDLAGAFGREGSRVLMNGRTDARVMVREGAPQRWHIVNAAKSRYFLLDLEGEPFTIVGKDGGLMESAVQQGAVAIAPGERVDVVVAPKRPLDWPSLVLRSGLLNRGFGSVEFRRVEQLLTIDFADLPKIESPARPATARSIAPIDPSSATRVEIELAFSQADGLTRYTVNGRPFSDARDLRARVGDTQIWTVTNKTKWSHPFHLHGFFFQVLDERREPVRPLAWKDTVDVPFDGHVSFAVRFDDRPGMWMYHCHILDHADLGLMGMLELLPQDPAQRP
jgi:FtsP/CotA-like multicopper oxidase with cupredoxin domain